MERADLLTQFQPATVTSVPSQASTKRLRGLVEKHIDFVARVVRNLGVPEADVDDAVQRTFIVVARRIDDIRPGAEKAFLFRTASNVGAQGRRSILRRREVPEEHAPEFPHAVETPEALVDQRRARRLLDRTLDAMSEDLRAVFVLFELEEMTMSEIAEMLDIPRGTVASRLRRARATFHQALNGPTVPSSEEAS